MVGGRECHSAEYALAISCSDDPLSVRGGREAEALRACGRARGERARARAEVSWHSHRLGSQTPFCFRQAPQNRQNRQLKHMR
jgi:hypothetical protein